MTVWIQNPFDNLPLEGNRPQRYWLMSEAFAAAGDSVVFWTSDFSHATKRRRVVQGDEGGKFRVLQLPTLPYPKNVCLARIRSHRAYARAWIRAGLSVGAAERPDVIISSVPTLAAASAALTLGRRLGAKVVIDVMDAWPETFERLAPAGLGALVRAALFPLRLKARRIYREADLVTGVCERYRALTRRDDYFLAYHGIAGAGSAEGREKRGEGGSPRRLVYIGNLGEGYDLETVVRSLARREGLSLDIAGLGPREKGLRALARELHVGDRVRFHGYLDARALRELLGACDVGVVPMRSDSWVGIPYKLCDYLAAGLPVVSSLGGECRALLERTHFGCAYDWQSVDSLLAAIESLRPVRVSLPDELRAEAIYPRYVRRVSVV